MPQPARAALENHYLSDDGIHERLLAMEEELIDHQVHGLLSPDQGEALKCNLLLSEDGSERMGFAKALAQLHMRRSQPPPRRSAGVFQQWSTRRAFVPSAIGATVLLVCAVLWRDLHPQSVRPEPTNRSYDQTDDRRNLAQTDRAPSFTVTLLLRSTSRDKSAGNILRIPSEHARIRLEAEFPGDERKSYYAVIRGVDGEQIQTSTDVKTHLTQSGTVYISADFPAELLKNGDYLFAIFIETENHSSDDELIAYAFAVVRTAPF
jgi:hypothetical protein